MHQVFISYVEEDSEMAVKIASGLEAAGYTTWYYQRDSVIGTDYLVQTGEAIEGAAAVVLLISSSALASHQITKEVHRAHECNRPFLPILRGITHQELQHSQPSWRQALGATVSLSLNDTNADPIAPKLVSGLQKRGIHPAPEHLKENVRVAPGNNKVASMPTRCRNCGADNIVEARWCHRCNDPLPIGANTVLGGHYRISSLESWSHRPHFCDALYLATDSRTGNKVSVRNRYCKYRAEFDYAVQIFQREAAAIRVLNDSHDSAPVPEVLQQVPMVQLVTEHVGGVCLDRQIKARAGQPFPFDQIIDWGIALCEILRKFHYHTPTWVLDRLAPSDIVITNNGPTLSDVSTASPLDKNGRAQRLSAPPDRKQKTQLDYAAIYRAPEAGRGRPEPRSDFFSLAAILYQLATGKEPDGSYTERELTEALQQKEFPYPAEQRWFFELLAANLSEERSERHVSVDELKDDLTHRRFAVRKNRTVRSSEPLLPRSCPNAGCQFTNSPLRRYCDACETPLSIPAGMVLHGQLEIESLLGEGGFSFVYQAHDLRVDRLIAVKDLACRDKRQRQVAYRFFKREAQILAVLSGLVSSVPRCFGSYVNEKTETARLFMEVVKGRCLGDLLRANPNKRFPFERVVQWGMMLCDLLHVMHSLNPPWIYRDMRPDHIVLLEDNISIKVLDFGSARPIEENAHSRNACTRVFTAGYSPPEQLQGRPVPQSDLFALAATLFHLASGNIPDGVITGVELGEKLADGDASIPESTRWFFDLLRRNLSERPQERSSSAHEFKQTLRRNLVMKPVQ